MPENGYGANLTKWSARLHAPLDMLQSIKLDAFISRKELFKAESKYWNEIIANYVRALHWKNMRLRNVMDMKAGFGGYCFVLFSFLLYKIRLQYFLIGIFNIFEYFADLQLH